MNNLRTTGIADEDDELRSRVKAFLGTQHFPKLRDLRVEVCGDTVTVQGCLNSFHERQVAIECCKRVAGVRQSIDEMSVVDRRAIPSARACDSTIHSSTAAGTFAVIQREHDALAPASISQLRSLICVPAREVEPCAG